MAIFNGQNFSLSIPLLLHERMVSPHLLFFYFLACHGSARSLLGRMPPLAQPALLKILPKHVVVTSIVLDDGLAKVFDGEPSSKVSVLCTSTNKLVGALWERIQRNFSGTWDALSVVL